MKDGDFFLDRCIKSIKKQSFKDYEIVMTKKGKMAENTNAAITEAVGEMIKILYMDDFLNHEESLQEIVANFSGGWLVTGCIHTDGARRFNPHRAVWNENIHLENTIGSPSVLTFANDDPLLFDERMTWMLDADYYRKLYVRYGFPTILDSVNVVIGVGDHQATHLLSDEIKLEEYNYIKQKYDTAI